MRVSVILPNPEADGVHAPYAKGQVRAFAKAEWRGAYLSRNIKIGDVSILMEVFSPDSGRVTIRSELPYMESGIMELLGTGTGGEPTYKPAIINFTPRVGSITAAGDPKTPNARGHKLEDGAETWTAAGCRPSTKLGEVTVNTGLGPQTFTSEPPAFCDPVKIVARKQLLARLKPSLYTGKLKLYVQALYGSARSDFRVDFSRDAEGELSVFAGTSPPTTPLESGTQVWVNLGYKSLTSGLITTPDGKYLLVEVGLSGITYREMRGAPRNNARLGRERETYGLAQLVPSAVERTAIGPDMAQIAALPLAYGWHFNNSGTEAAIVVYRNKDITGPVAFTTRTATIGGYEFALYVLAFSYAPDTGVLSYELRLADAGQHIPYLFSKVFSPTPTGLKLLVPSSAPPYESVATELSAPLYCFYTDDKLNVVRGSVGNYTFVAASGDPAWRLGLNASEMLATGVVFQKTTGDVVPSNADVSMQVSPARWQSTLHGFSIDGSSFAGRETYAPGQTIFERWSLRAGGRMQDFSYFNADGVLIGAFSQTLGRGSEAVQVTKTDLRKVPASFFVIPHGDASAAILGFREMTMCATGSRTRGTIGANLPYIFADSPLIPSGLPRGGPNRWSYGAGLGGVLDESAPTGDMTDFKNSTFIQVGLFCAAGMTELYRSVGEALVTNETFPDTSGYASLFEASESSATVGRFMTVTSSYFGAVRHDGCLSPNDPSGFSGYMRGWPEYKNPAGFGLSVPVGWA